MTNSPSWSDASAPCRFDWRPSRWLIAGLGVLALLAAISVLASDLPRWVAWPVAAIALFRAVWLARRESLMPPRELAIHPARFAVEVDGQRVDDFRLQWRGVLAFARWRDAQGRTSRLVWWPDTLPADKRRELRLAAPVETSPRAPASMAP